MYRRNEGKVQFFLVHPGGPFYTRKNEGVWTIPKGLVDLNEELLNAAKREFLEETGIKPKGNFFNLGTIRMKSGKEVHCWMFEGEWDETFGITSNTFDMEWPPKSGKHIQVPEADRGAWMEYDEAIKMIHPSQTPFLERALKTL